MRERSKRGNLVELPVDFVWAKLFKKAPELQGINSHDLCASPLPVISETNKRDGFFFFFTFLCATKGLGFGQMRQIFLLVTYMLAHTK